MNIKHLITLLLVVPAMAWGQRINVKVYPYTPDDSEWLYEDDFQSYTTGPIDGQGNWTDGLNDGIIIENVSGDKRAAVSTDDVYHVIYYEATIGGDMVVQCVVDSLQNGRSIGPGVRCTGTSGYVWHSSPTASWLDRFDGGTRSQFASGTAWSLGDVVRLEVYGDTLYCYRNGSLDTSVSSDGKYEVTSGTKLSGGYAGFGGYDASTYSSIDYWKAKNR